MDIHQLYGKRHKTNVWPRSAVTNHYHKTAFPENAGKNSKFVLVFGDSHLRRLVDGYVQMPECDLRFGYSSTPGACAAALYKEVLNETLPEELDLVCLIAPGNNLSNNTIQQAGKEFASLIPSAQGTWNKVVVIDFPNQLTVEFPYQDMLRQEYHRVAAHECKDVNGGNVCRILDVDVVCYPKAYRPGQREVPEQERGERKGKEKGKQQKGKRKEKKISVTVQRKAGRCEGIVAGEANFIFLWIH
ncbi:UNVERIFIED_CONTAM: hypothetical protein FKN15_000677 [Acipenser sinensis]